MHYRISAPDRLRANLRLPASKSISNRALILHALSGGHTLPANLSSCDDTRVMTEALARHSSCIDIGAAGTAMRFLTAYFSTVPGVRTLTGTPRMQQRPIRILVDALRSLGASIGYAGKEGFPPLCIEGKRLESRRIVLEGDVSSQYISALLMIGPTLPEGLQLQLAGDIVSRPYIDLTLQLMRDFGAVAAWTGTDSIDVQPGSYKDTAFVVESDWSAASYWYEMLALAAFGQKGESGKEMSAAQEACVELQGLFAHSLQGDSRGAVLFERLGVCTGYTPQGVRLTPQGSPASSVEADLVEMPDLAQTFVVTCCLLNVPFRFGGLQSLRIKETDRIHALVTELRKLGYVVQAEGNSVLRWSGERCEAAADPCIATYEDHRMAMAFAPACLVRPDIRIDRPEVVSKSYPAYWDDLRQAGFHVEQGQD